jgi:acyl-CoA hydrolase
MPAHLTPALFADCLHRAQRVYWPGCAAHSPLFEAWWRQVAPGLASITVAGVWVPGVNRFDPTAAGDGVRAEAFFASPELRSGIEQGRVDLLPLHYSEIVRRFESPGAFDLALLQVAPPDDQGRCSLSVNADFAPSVLRGLAGAGTVLAHVNPRLPGVRGPWVHASRIQAWVDAERPLLTLPDEPLGPVLKALASRVAEWVPDGATLQFGLGRVQAAVLAALTDRRRLRVHGGMVSDGLLRLLQAGALDMRGPDAPAACTATALGSEPLYAALTDPALARFEPVSMVHAHATLSALPGLVSINAALEVDLMGNVNAEWLDGRQVSGIGGLVDFVRGARASPGGRSVIALPASSKGVSRIVPCLAAGTTGIARHDVDTVVTEHGCAELRGLDLDRRAQALLAIADPQHRPALESAWHTLKRRL